MMGSERVGAALTGVDVLYLGELDRLLGRSWFRRYAYADEELAYADDCSPDRAREFLTGRFAAKEAVVKVLGTGFRHGVRPCQVVVVRGTDGAPAVRLTGAAAVRGERLRVAGVHVSIAHKRDLIVATAVATHHTGEGRDGRPAEHTVERHAEGREPMLPAPDSPTVSALLRVRLGQRDAHYGGGLVSGARILELFGDLVTEVTIRTDGDEGLLAEYSDVRFTAPVHPGDYVEAAARLVRSTRLRRVVELTAYKVITACQEGPASGAAVLEEPELVCRATATTVIPLHSAVTRTRATQAGAPQSPPG